MHSTPAPLVPAIIQLHAEEAAILYNIRTRLTVAPHVTLREVLKQDERLAAHLDGLSVAGEQGWPFCNALLEAPSEGAVFTGAVRAVEDRATLRLDRLFALTGALPRLAGGIIAAFEWLDADRLQGIVVQLLASDDALRRTVGIAACSTHRVDAGLVSARRLEDSDAGVRARALRAAGEIGLAAAIPACMAAIRGDDQECRFWAAWATVLLGERGSGPDVLTDACFGRGPHRARSLRLAMQTLDLRAAHEVLQRLAQNPIDQRWLIGGAGIAGDPEYVPWLIKRMQDPATARLAGEAFTLITGGDLDQLKLDRARPTDFESGPTDDPDDPDVDMDPDDDLPWPDPQKIEKWWAANSSRFQKGTRYFMGAPVTREHCIEVLKTGYQRQRILAAHYLCLLEPGTPLFNTSAPAWRQQRLLAKMT
jgi:uncharacterized protein (TIGR02270 family)